MTTLPAQPTVPDTAQSRPTHGIVARTGVLLYGLVGYVSFLVTIVWAMLFVADAWAAKTMNTGTVVSFGETILVNLGLMLLFAVQHTIMARPAFKAWITRFIPKAMERSTFVLASSGCLLLLFWQWRPLPETIWSIDWAPAKWLVIGISVLGWGMVFLSSFLIDHFDLFGLRQVVLHARRVPYYERPFMLRSLYKLVRHPLMLGFLIAFWSTPHMTQGHLLFAGVITAYILFGIKIEERELVRQHGESYLAYRRKTPGLIPVKLGKSA